MEDSSIESPTRCPNTCDKSIAEDNSGLKPSTEQKPELANTSNIPVDNKKNIDHINNPVDSTCRNINDKTEVLRNKEDSLAHEKIHRILSGIENLAAKNQSDNENKEGIVGALKDFDSVPDVAKEEKKMTKPTRSRASCRKETSQNSSVEKQAVKSIPVKNTSRKVLAEKQIRSARATCYEPGIFLRSSRKKGTNLLTQNSVYSNTLISDQNKVTETSTNQTDCNNGEKSVDAGNYSSVKENILPVSGLDSDPLNLGNEKQDAAKIETRKVVPFKSLATMEKKIIRKHEKIVKIQDRVPSTPETNDDGVLNNEEKNLTDDTAEKCIKNEIVPKKRYHRRKCSEPFKNERIQTRQSRSIMLLQNKIEHEYFPQVPETVKCIPDESDKKTGEKKPAEVCTIICTPDINMNDQVQETLSDENQKTTSCISHTMGNPELRNGKDEHALNFTEISPANEISPCNKDDSRCTVSTNPKIFPRKNDCSTVQIKSPQLSRKQEQENADGHSKRKLKHINAQAMPIYVSRIAVTKNENVSRSLVAESLLLLQSSNAADKSSDIDNNKEKQGESRVEMEKQAQNFFDSISLRRKSDKTVARKYPYLSNTDSDDTLSNVESVPNSPAQETKPKDDGKYLKLNNECLKLNSGQSILWDRNLNLATHRISTDVNLNIAENDNNVELKSLKKRKYLETEISSTMNCGTNRNEAEPRYYVETSANGNPSRFSDGSESNAKNIVGNDDLRGPQEMPWLRHYERPQKTHTHTAENASEFENNRKQFFLQQSQNLQHQKQKYVKMNKKSNNTFVADNSASGNLRATEEYTCNKGSKNLPQAVINPPPRKRGRPRKQGTQSSEQNSESNKRSKPSSRRAAPNGSGLTKLELERLFFKFLQHGHFRIAPGQSPIIIHNNDLHKRFSARMQCYDPRNQPMHPHNMGTKNNPENNTYTYSQQHLPTDNDGNRFYGPNNSSSSEHGNSPRTMNLNSRNSSHKHVGQTTYSKNLNPCSTNTANTHSHTDSDKAQTNTSSYNEITYMNSASNYMPSGYGTASNYHQNFYNNNANYVMGNNSYSNSYSGIVNSNGSMNNMNTGTGTAATYPLSTTNNFYDDLNFLLNSQDQIQNSMPCREIDLTISNGNTVSNNSVNNIQNSPTNNINPDWNPSNVNQHLDSVNGILMDLNSMNNQNKSSQAIDGSSTINNVMSNSNSMMNSPNPWINRSNNMMNPPFPVLQPWHATSPMYNSYLNNGNPYHNNMFNPYAAFVGFDISNYPYSNMNSRNGMGFYNENPWMQNIFPNPGSLQEDTSNQGMNLSISVSNDAIPPQTNSMELDDSSNLGMGQDDLDSNKLGLDLNVDSLKENIFAQVQTDNKNDRQQSAQSYGEQISSSYSMGFKNDSQNPDFNDMEMTDIDENNIDNQQQQNLPLIQDYINQRSDSLESCVNRNYKHAGPPSCENGDELPDNRETEMSILRQELADFTRQYSEAQTSPTLEIPQGQEIFI